MKFSELGDEDKLPTDRLSDLDLDVVDVVRYDKLLALLSSGETIFARERVGLHADPDDDGGNGLSDDADTNNVRACPLHALGLIGQVEHQARWHKTCSEARLCRTAVTSSMLGQEKLWSSLNLYHQLEFLESLVPSAVS